MNINDKSAVRNCTSCQMCGAVCPSDAICISLDKNGFYRPILDDVKCINCSLCTQVCYKFEQAFDEFGKGKLATTKLIAASAKSDDIIFSTTSGGIGDLLAHYLFKNGFKCIGVVYDSQIGAVKDVIANDEEELKGFRGSKYIQSYTIDAFKQLVKEIRYQKFAVFGTPCHIYAIDKYLCKLHLRDHCVLIDLYCHGCPSMNVWKKYLAGIKQGCKDQIIDNANFRSKHQGWGTFNISASSSGKTIFKSNRNNNDFFDMFFSDVVLNDACNDCLLRGTLQYTDIRLGDFWGKQYVLNHKGVSAVSLVTEKGKDIFKAVAHETVYREERYEDFLPWQSWGKIYHPNQSLRELIFSQLNNPSISLRNSIETIHNFQPIKHKFISKVKNIILKLPVNIVSWVRWFFYKF